MEKNRFLDFFDVKNKRITLKKPAMDIILPLSYFDRGIAYWNSDRLELLGLLESINIYDSLENDSNYENISMLLPMMFTTVPSNMEKQKIVIGEDIEDIYVLEYVKGDVFMESHMLIRNSDTVAKLINMMISSFMPTFITYENLVEIWNDCAKLNGVKMPLPVGIKDLTVANICRYVNDRSLRFGEYLNKNPQSGSENMVMVKLQEIPQKSNIFAAIASQYYREGAEYALQNPKSSNTSPLELDMYGGFPKSKKL